MLVLSSPQRAPARAGSRRPSVPHPSPPPNHSKTLHLSTKSRRALQNCAIVIKMTLGTPKARRWAPQSVAPVNEITLETLLGSTGPFVWAPVTYVRPFKTQHLSTESRSGPFKTLHLSTKSRSGPSKRSTCQQNHVGPFESAQLPSKLCSRAAPPSHRTPNLLDASTPHDAPRPRNAQ